MIKKQFTNSGTSHIVANVSLSYSVGRRSYFLYLRVYNIDSIFKRVYRRGPKRNVPYKQGKAHFEKKIDQKSFLLGPLYI